MSDKETHLARAASNEVLAGTLTDPYWHWAVTVVFYAVVHYIEAYFSTLIPPKHSGHHGHRDSDIRRDSVLAPAYRDYMHMKDDSENARYEPHIPFDANHLKVQWHRLEAVKQILSTRL